MTALAMLSLTACLVTTEGTAHEPRVGEFQRCTVERYCGGIGSQDLGTVTRCTDDRVELENRIAFECWSTADECAGGFCDVECSGTSMPCLFTPEEP